MHNETMNDELKIADLKADKKRIENEISELVTDRLRYFMDKYGVEADIDVDVRQCRTDYGDIFDICTYTNLEFKL